MKTTKPVPRRFLFDTLEAIVLIGGHGTIVQISAASGYEPSGFQRYSLRMQRTDLIDAPFGKYAHPGVYVITERGKIALAIEMGCRTRARATKAKAMANAEAKATTTTMAMIPAPNTAMVVATAQLASVHHFHEI